MTIRRMELQDAKAVTTIYNEYILYSVATFETEPLREEDMRRRMAEISAHFPFFVCEEEGKLIGYCYACLWKQRAAYYNTLETTVYVQADYAGRGIGKTLMRRLIEECKRNGYHALIACITQPNEACTTLHTDLGYQKMSHFKEVGLKFGRWLDVADYELLLTD